MPATSQLVLMIHHLAVDGVSWRILLEDLNIAWALHHGGQPVRLPQGGTSFARWSHLLAEHAGDAKVVAHADEWRGVLEVPSCSAAGAAGCGYLRQRRPAVGGELDVETTRQGARAGSCGISRRVQDILMIAFGLAWAEYLGTGSLPIDFDVEGHGRSEDIGERPTPSSIFAYRGLVLPPASGRVGNAGTALGSGDFG